MNCETKYIVSLTSFPARYDKLWLTLSSILRQDRLPDAIILCIPVSELSDLRLLPASLQRLQELGVSIIHYKHNLLPHNKYHAAAIKYPKANIITIDDDVIYPPDLLKKLIDQHGQYPSSICCGLSRKILVKENKPAPYGIWPYVSERSGPRKDNLVMGVGGALYPGGFFNDELLEVQKISSMCLKADDIWLTVHALRKGYQVACIAGDYSRFPLPVINKGDTHLSHENIGSMNNIYFNQLLNHYQISVNSFIHADN